jgi:ribosomal protein S18 acetylase RimI-like enzyme
MNVKRAKLLKGFQLSFGKFDISFVRHLDESDLIVCLDILRSGVKGLYDESGEWNEEEKMDDLSAKWMRFLVVKTMEGEIVAFSALRFDKEDDREVLYIYELHVSPKCQGAGIGSELIIVMHDLAKTQKLDCLMLTSLKCNERANRFYLKSG